MKNIFSKVIVSLILLPFITSSIINPRLSFAQEALILPPAGTMVGMSSRELTPIIRGMKVNPQNPFDLDFIIDQGKSSLSSQELKEDTRRMVKYFLAVLTIPQGDLWVNLSPYEKDRITTNDLGVTELGRDMLAQDYLLKQLSASLTYPQTELGKKFWGEIYRKVQQIYGNTQMKVNTFNKVWIVPQKVVVFQRNNTIFIVDAHLKAMMEEDYTALMRNQKNTSTRHTLASEVMRNIILPQVEKEVNEGSNFAMLRQIYNAFIMAIWYKRNLKNSILSNIYFNQKKTTGVDVQDKAVGEKIYQQYLRAFKKGVYNLIKEDPDIGTGGIVPHKYFSGGVDLTQDYSQAMVSTGEIPKEAIASHELSDARVHLRNLSQASAAMTSEAYRIMMGTVSNLMEAGQWAEAGAALAEAMRGRYGDLGIEELTDGASIIRARKVLKDSLEAKGEELKQMAIRREKVENVKAMADEIDLMGVTMDGLATLNKHQKIERMRASGNLAAGEDTPAEIQSKEQAFQIAQTIRDRVVEPLDAEKVEKTAEKGRIEGAIVQEDGKIASANEGKKAVAQITVKKYKEQVSAEYDKQIREAEEAKRTLGGQLEEVNRRIAEINGEIEEVGRGLEEMRKELFGDAREKTRQAQERQKKATLLADRIGRLQETVKLKIGEMKKNLAEMGLTKKGRGRRTGEAARTLLLRAEARERLAVLEEIPLSIKTWPALGALLKERRVMLSTELSNMSRSLRIAAGLIAKYENGEALPAQEHIAPLARYLKIDAEDLNTTIKILSQPILTELRTPQGQEIQAPQQLGAIYKAQKRKLGLTRKELAKKIGVTMGMIGFYERGDLPIKNIDQKIARLAHAYRIDESVLRPKIMEFVTVILKKRGESFTRFRLAKKAEEAERIQQKALSIDVHELRRMISESGEISSEDVFEKVITYVQRLTDLTRDQSEQLLKGFGLGSIEDIQKERGLATISPENISNVIDLVQVKINAIESNVSDQEFYTLLVHEFQVLTDLGEERVKDFLSTAVGITMSTPEGRIKLQDQRARASLALRLKGLDSDEVQLEILEANGVSGEELRGLVIRKVAELHKITVEQARQRLEELGYKTVADFMAVNGPGELALDVSEKFESLREKLNRQLVLLGQGYPTEAIKSTAELRGIFDSHVFRLAIRRNPNPKTVFKDATTPKPSIMLP